MLKRMLAGIGIGGARSGPVPAASSHEVAPYKDAALNHMYNLLFCDDLELFRAGINKEQGPWSVLLQANPDSGALSAIADDTQHESRLRALAYNRLRQLGQPVPAKLLLGVIVEVGLGHGLDVLAGFADGRVRYINQTGKMSLFEGGPPEVVTRVAPLLAASQSVVDKIGPWNKPRLPPPANGMMRLTFIVSDGLYFGQGPIEELQRDETGGAVVAAAVALLRAVVDASVKQ